MGDGDGGVGGRGLHAEVERGGVAGCEGGLEED